MYFLFYSNCKTVFVTIEHILNQFNQFHIFIYYFNSNENKFNVISHISIRILGSSYFFEEFRTRFCVLFLQPIMFFASTIYLKPKLV
jgi:hypothetical protein